MKNIFKILFSAMLALSIIGCTKETEAVEDNRIATPEFTLSVHENSITVVWEAVEGAAYYEVGLTPGSIEKTDMTIHRFDNLDYGVTYVVKLQAIAADAAKSSKVGQKSITIGERIAPAYREFIPRFGAAAQAISNNGRWVVGGYDRKGFVLDLNNDKMVEFETAEFYDVADDGTAVGSNHAVNPDGDAAILIGDTMVDIDISNIAVNAGMSCATGITPDGEFIVGWFWEYDDSCYYAQRFGSVVPFYYDVITGIVAVPELGDRIYNEAGATAIKAVAPDRTMLGYEQSMGIHSIIWADEYTPYEYVHFDYDDSNYNPLFSLGDTQNLFTQSGRYVYGKAIDYTSGQVEIAAAYDRNTDTLHTFTGGAVTAMSDDGIVFINDAPFYIGTTSYVVDITKGEPYVNVPLEEWVFDVHDIDIAAFDPMCDEDKDNNILLEGAITISTSANGRIIVGIENTQMGYINYVIDLDGETGR